MTIRTHYPGYDVLAQQGHWDVETRKVVLERLKEPGELEFFAGEDERTMTVLLTELLGDDSGERLRWVLRQIDAFLAAGKSKGYWKAKLPPRDALFRKGIDDLNDSARRQFGVPFADLEREARSGIIAAFTRDDPLGSRDFLIEVLEDAATYYTSLPGVWSEMGYGGPAYPRGYVRIELGAKDPWEAVLDSESKE